MTAPAAPPAANPFPGYHAPDGCYNELCGADGAPRGHWQRLVDLLGSWQPGTGGAMGAGPPPDP